MRRIRRREFLAEAGALSVTVAAASTCPPAASAAGTSDVDQLLAPWTGPHGGLPPFDKVRVEAFGPALRAGMEMQRAEIAAIARNPASPTFENTIVALEEAGRPLERVRSVFGTYVRTMNVGPMRALETEMSPVLAAFGDEIVQNGTLFARIKAAYDARETAGLTSEQQRLTTVVYDRFDRQGAALDATHKARLGQINQQLARLYTTFSQNQLADEEGYTLMLDRPEDLAGMPESLRASAARAAAEKGRPGSWAITNTRSSMEPFLTYASRRDLREKGWRLWIMRGDNAGAHDNKPVITEIMQLRAEKATLLGHPTYAHWITAANMAKTPDAAMALMMQVWPAAVARVHQEVADMQAVVDAERGGFKIAPWDYRYYAEKVRKAKYDLDQDEVKGYLQLERIREGMFWAAGQLYGLEFVPAPDVPVYQADMRVYEVRRAGARIGLWYFDPYARNGKASGAWMNAYRPQESLHDETPIVSNNVNFIKGTAGKPVLISWQDAVTMFHEFGHALHGLNSNVTYQTLAGTAVARDFVEFPSQLNEHWLATPEVLNRFALHHETGKPMSRELLAKIERAHTFNEGFATTEYLSAAIYDMRIHLAAHGQAIDPDAFEQTVMAELGMPAEIVMRHRPTQFGHIFSGDGYSAGYYDYLWADTLTADAYEAFTEAGGPYDKAVAKRLYASIMSVGNTVPPEEAFRRFRGRDVDTAALMRDRGFPVTKTGR
jgi:peptidyl-dipeptidase Dcp